MSRCRPGTPRSVDAALRAAESRLAGAGIESPRLDAELLLCHVRATDRARLLADLRELLDAGDEDRFERLIERRLAREPIAYILGSAWFHGLRLEVTPDVLIPRPETELLVDWALSWIRGRSEALRILDVGTGSGAIALAVTAALRQPLESQRKAQSHAEIIAGDISPAALNVARRNARRLDLEGGLRFVEADLLPEGPERYDLVLANLPYIGLDDRDRVMEDVDRYEPHLALYSGTEGLEHYERLIAGLRGRLRPGAALAFEIGDRQGQMLERRLSRACPGAIVRVHRDLAGLDRMVTAEGLAGEGARFAVGETVSGAVASDGIPGSRRASSNVDRSDA